MAQNVEQGLLGWQNVPPSVHPGATSESELYRNLVACSYGAHPFFHGERIYFRSRLYLYCIGKR